MEETLNEKELQDAENVFELIKDTNETLAAGRYPDKRSEDYYKERVELLEASLRLSIKQSARWESLTKKWEESRKRNS